jgi:hypothetical protein
MWSEVLYALVAAVLLYALVSMVLKVIGKGCDVRVTAPWMAGHEPATADHGALSRPPGPQRPLMPRCARADERMRRSLGRGAA